VEGQKDPLVAEGMSPRRLDDPNRVVGEFESASEAARTARLDHIGARTDLEPAAAELLEQGKVLDRVNRWRFAEDPELLMEWNAAKRLPSAAQGRMRQPPAT
jgi:hypothetical protein